MEEIEPERQKSVLEGSMRKKCQRHKEVNISYSQSPIEQQNCLEETTESENPLRREQLVGSEDLNGEIQGDPEGFPPTETKK